MNPLRQYCVLIFLSSSLLFLSCKDDSAESPNQFQIGGNYAITVHAVQYDEFERAVPFSGTAALQLITTEQTYHGIILNGSSSYTFKNVSSQHFILRAEKDGFYPYEGDGVTAVFHPLPSPEMRIDSIIISSGTDYNSDNIKIHLVTAQAMPAGYSRLAVAFIGSSPDVSPQPGTYFGISEEYQNSNSLYIDLYYPKSLLVSPTNTIYVTARFFTGATVGFHDAETNKRAFANLENNTTIVASYVFK